METARLAKHAPSNSARTVNRTGRSPFVIVCEHASNHIPDGFGTLGLDVSDMTRHIAWDPGALPVARLLSAALDAPLVEAGVSRLMIDCNRPLDAPDLIPEISETTRIPGNAGLSAAQRAERVALSYTPFHTAVDALIVERAAQGRESWLVSIHSFTPVYKLVSRPWQVGIIHDDDRRLSDPVIAALRAIDGLNVGVNEPYSPTDRVYFTLEKHARSRGLPCAMVEIRNNEIADAAGQERWASRFANILATLSREGLGELEATGMDGQTSKQQNSRGK